MNHQHLVPFFLTKQMAECSSRINRCQHSRAANRGYKASSPNFFPYTNLTKNLRIPQLISLASPKLSEHLSSKTRLGSSQSKKPWGSEQVFSNYKEPWTIMELTVKKSKGRSFSPDWRSSSSSVEAGKNVAKNIILANWKIQIVAHQGPN